MTLSRLKSLDLISRKFVRRVLHLPPDTPTAYFHASQKDGGLAIPCLRAMVPVLARSRFAAGAISACPFTRAVYSSPGMGQIQRKGAQFFKLNGHRVLTKEASSECFREALYTSVDGRELIRHQRSGYNSYWIINKEANLKSGEYIQACQVRGNLLKTPSRASRGVNRLPVAQTCAVCPDRRQNLSHMVQTCSASKELRIDRHNAVLRQIQSGLFRKGLTVELEPRIKFRGSYLKPDLVAFEGSRVTVLDVTITTASGSYCPVKLKQEKYGIREVYEYCVSRFPSELRSKLLRVKPEVDARGNCRLDSRGNFIGTTGESLPVSVIPVSLDWRGCWDSVSWRLCRKALQLPSGLLELCSVKTLVHGRIIFQTLNRRSDFGIRRRLRGRRL